MIRGFNVLFLLILVFNPAFSQTDGLDDNSFESSNEPNVEKAIEINPTETFTEDSNENEIESDSEAEPESDMEDLSDSVEFDDNVNVPIPESKVLPEPKTTVTDDLRVLNPILEESAKQQGYFPSFDYEDRGRKDPFEPSINIGPEQFTQETTTDAEGDDIVREGLLKYETTALTLTAILIGKNSKPKALVKDPAGIVYSIQENDKIGRNNGVVKRIRQGQVVVVEFRDQKEGDRLYTTQILSLGK